MMKCCKKTIVKRKDWYRGQGSDFSGLAVGESYCCLGFLCLQSGIPEQSMQQSGLPSDLEDSLVELDSDFEIRAARINDDTNIDDRERERRLVNLWQRYDLEIEFVD